MPGRVCGRGARLSQLNLRVAKGFVIRADGVEGVDPACAQLVAHRLGHVVLHVVQSSQHSDAQCGAGVVEGERNTRRGDQQHRNQQAFHAL